MFSHSTPSKFNSSFKGPKMKPAQTIVLGFLIVILIGTACLSLPSASPDGESINFIDSLSIATSATCVTGLGLMNIDEQFTVFGQIVILVLIQIGGLGIMAVSTLLFLILGKRIGFQNRYTLQESFNQASMSGIVKLTKHLIIATLCVEGIGALIFAIRFSFDMPVSQAVYFGIFHSVSSFCNAGLSLLAHTPTSFMNISLYSHDYLVRFVMMILIILGGLGFPVIMELIQKKRNKVKRSLHTRLVLIITAILIFAGAFLFFLFEHNNPATIGNMGFGEKIFSSFFTSITIRTAGFGLGNTSSFRTATLAMTIILMFIGASPSSTGGGVKTTTIGILVASVVSTIRGYNKTVIFQKRIPQETINKSLTIIVLSFAILITGVIFLSTIENIEFMDIIFEAASAFSTTGLSTGATERFSDLGRIILACLMFVGRLGPITVAVALSHKNRQSTVHYPEEKVLIG